MTFPFQGPKTRINNVWIIFIDPLILGYRFFLNFTLFSPQSLRFLLFHLSVLAFSPGSLLAPSKLLCWNSSPCSSCCFSLCPWTISSPSRTPSNSVRPSLTFRGVSLLAGMTSLANLLASVIKSQLLRFMRSEACRKHLQFMKLSRMPGAQTGGNLPKFLMVHLFANVVCVFFIIQALQVFKWPIRMFFWSSWDISLRN